MGAPMDCGEAQSGWYPVLLPRVADFEGSCPRKEPRLEVGATQERLRRQKLSAHPRLIPLVQFASP